MGSELMSPWKKDHQDWHKTKTPAHIAAHGFSFRIHIYRADRIGCVGHNDSFVSDTLLCPQEITNPTQGRTSVAGLNIIISTNHERMLEML